MIQRFCALNLNRSGRELQPHGSVEFPCAAYSSWYTNVADDVIPWHWHEEIELLYVETGRIKLRIPGNTFHLSEGQGFVINSNILHFAVAEPSCQLKSIVFAPQMLSGGSDTVFARKYITPLVASCAFDGIESDYRLERHTYNDRFETAFTAMSREEPGYEFVVRDCLSQICLDLFRYYQVGGGEKALPVNQDSIRIRKMLDYMHEHYGEALKLIDISRAANIGERECLRCFKRVIHESPIQYLQKYRIMQAAAMLLESTDCNIAEIAIQCGFDSHSNFTHTFKRFFNCTPRNYRIGKQLLFTQEL